MKELIPVTRQAINETETLTCDARALHEFMESRQDFSTWIKNRIEKYGFIEGVDFASLHKIVERATGGTTRIEYTLSIDMAKQLAMVENNDKGMEVRRYFINCERIAKEAARLISPRPQRSSAEITARSVAVSFRQLARMKEVYPPEMLAYFASRAAAALTGEPLQPLLPSVQMSRESWLSPTALGERFSVAPVTIGRLLKSLGLHGSSDSEHRHSLAVWDKSPFSDKQVISYLYDPDIVLPRLAEALGNGKSVPADGEVTQ